MFLGKDEYLITLLGVFLLKRNKSKHDSFPYYYDALGVRTSGGCTFTVNDTTTKVHKGDIVYLPRNTPTPNIPTERRWWPSIF